MNRLWLGYALYAGVAYFCCMAVAHFFGIKLPLLFVYYDTPYYAYQDKIIAFAVIAYAGLFYAAAKNRSVVPVALLVLAITVAGLASVNRSDALAAVLDEHHSLVPYWLQTGLIALYLATLVILYYRSRG